MKRILDCKVTTVGGSKGVVIPKKTAGALHLDFGDIIKVTIEK